MSDRKQHQKRLAVINDFTGFGRCSLTVSIPVISQLGVQCCPVPTSIFSNHTAFPSFYFEDYTEKMPAYIAEWKKMDLRFEGIRPAFSVLISRSLWFWISSVLFVRTVLSFWLTR